MTNEELDKEVERLRAENDRLQGWVDDLLAGCYVNCVYCGKRYGPEESTPVSQAEVLKRHVQGCPEHPMSKLRAAVDGAVELLGGTSANSATAEAYRILKEAYRILKEARS